MKAKILQISNSSFLENTGYHSFGDFCTDVKDQWQSSVLTEFKPASAKRFNYAMPHARLETMFNEVNLRLAEYLCDKSEFADQPLDQITDQLAEHENCAARYLFALWGIEPRSLLKQPPPSDITISTH